MEEDNKIVVLFPLVLYTKLAQTTKRLVEKMKDHTLPDYLDSLEEKKVNLKVIK